MTYIRCQFQSLFHLLFINYHYTMIISLFCCQCFCEAVQTRNTGQQQNNRQIYLQFCFGLIYDVHSMPISVIMPPSVYKLLKKPLYNDNFVVLLSMLLQGCANEKYRSTTKQLTLISKRKTSSNYQSVNETNLSMDSSRIKGIYLF